MLLRVSGSAPAGLAHEFVTYFVRRAPIPTLVPSSSLTERDSVEARVRQRIGLGVERFAILNIHRIGIEAPALLVWEKSLDWGPASTYWPMRIAPMERPDGSPRSLEVFLFGRKKPLPVLGEEVFGLDFMPLFRMELLAQQDTPGIFDPDNGRYLLYRCVGGYPIGLFSLYVRSGIPSEGERERTHFFFVVAFDFYGRPHWSRSGPVRWTWERIHNRVTSNVLNLFKRECEEEFAARQRGA
jgi:hypothetical protein